MQEYYSVTLTNSPSGGNFFGNNLLAISGVKFEDLNGNSAKDSDEPGLEGWTIKLKRDGTEVASTLTITGGAYSFAGITPGSYTVEEVSKQCWADLSRRQCILCSSLQYWTGCGHENRSDFRCVD